MNKESLADEIMKELISDPRKPHYEPSKFDMPKPLQFPASPKRVVHPHPAAQKPVEPQRQNYLVNERELQKNKLQNQKHQGLFPNSSDHNKVRSLGKQQNIPVQDKKISPMNERNPQMPLSPKRHEPKAKFDPTYNPFVPDDEIEKQRKEEKHRQYLK